MPTPTPSTLPPWSHESHRRQQARRGLELSPAERLHWLETTMDQMRALLGRAATRPAGVGREADSTDAEVTTRQ